MTIPGSRRSGSPTTSTSVSSSGTRARIRPVSSRSRAASAAASARTARSEAAAATAAGMFSNPGARPDSRSSDGPGGENRTPLRTASSPIPAGPPHLCALAASSDQAPSTGPQASDCAASTSSGTPAERHASAASATGCTVPTSWLADCRHASAVSARRPSANSPASTAPPRSTPTRVTVPPSASCRSAACRTHECSTDDTIRCCPARRRPASAPAMPVCTARVPEVVKTSSSGRQPTASAAASRAASSSSRARRPSRWRRAGSAHPSSREACRAWRATGWRGTAEAASKYGTPVRYRDVRPRFREAATPPPGAAGPGERPSTG